jgi:hypothetical protein
MGSRIAIDNVPEGDWILANWPPGGNAPVSTCRVHTGPDGVAEFRWTFDPVKRVSVDIDLSEVTLFGHTRKEFADAERKTRNGALEPKFLAVYLIPVDGKPQIPFTPSSLVEFTEEVPEISVIHVGPGRYRVFVAEIRLAVRGHKAWLDNMLGASANPEPRFFERHPLPEIVAPDPKSIAFDAGEIEVTQELIHVKHAVSKDVTAEEVEQWTGYPAALIRNRVASHFQRGGP